MDLLQNITNLGINLNTWKRDIFGKPNKKIKCLLKTIENLEAKHPTPNAQTLINKKMLELEALYDTQEEIAKQHSRNNTIALGERNTKLKRRKRNNINCIQDKNNTVVSSRDEIDETLTSYFSELFTKSSIDPEEEISSHIKSTISIEENLTLTAIPSPEEIWMVVKNLKSNKAPGPDGFPVSFFKHNWVIVGSQLVAVVKDFFKNKNLDINLNKTYLFLIPKTKHPKTPTDYIPIGLYNTPYKVIAKLMANRPKNSLNTSFIRCNLLFSLLGKFQTT